MHPRGGHARATRPASHSWWRSWASTGRPFVLAVPRVFEKIHNGAQQKAARATAERRSSIAPSTSPSTTPASAPPAAAPLRTRLLHAVFDRLVYGKLRAALGRPSCATRCPVARPLGERLGHFFNGVGITILEGYGMTETTAGAHINRPAACGIGTVGKPVPGASVRIAEDGEILLQGGHVFRGYSRTPRRPPRC